MALAFGIWHKLSALYFNIAPNKMNEFGAQSTQLHTYMYVLVHIYDGFPRLAIARAFNAAFTVILMFATQLKICSERADELWRLAWARGWKTRSASSSCRKCRIHPHH